MPFADFRKVTGVSSARALQSSILASRNGYRNRRRGIERAYLMASGAILYVGLSQNRCRRHVRSVAKVTDACGFWFTKNGRDSGFKLFEASFILQRPADQSTIDFMSTFFDRFAGATDDRLMASRTSRAIHWNFQVANERYSAYLYQHSEPGSFRLSMIAKDLYAGGKRYGRRLKRMRAAARQGGGRFAARFRR